MYMIGVGPKKIICFCLSTKTDKVEAETCVNNFLKAANIENLNFYANFCLLKSTPSHLHNLKSIKTKLGCFSTCW